MQHRPCRERVVANDLMVYTYDEGARSTFQLVSPGALLEPEIELWPAAAKGIQLVRLCEGRRLGDCSGLLYRSQGARLANSRLKALLVFTGASRRLAKRSKRLASSAKTVRSSSTC